VEPQSPRCFLGVGAVAGINLGIRPGIQSPSLLPKKRKYPFVWSSGFQRCGSNQLSMRFLALFFNRLNYWRQLSMAWLTPVEASGFAVILHLWFFGVFFHPINSPHSIRALPKFLIRNITHFRHNHALLVGGVGRTLSFAMAVYWHFVRDIRLLLGISKRPD